MRKLVILITAVFFLIIDQTVIPFLSIYGFYASVLFTFFALFSLKSDYEDAILVAVITGVLQDIYFPYGFGLHTLLNLFIFLGLSKIGVTLKEGRKVLPMIFVTLAHAVKTLVIILLLKGLGISVDYMSMVMIPLYALILSVLLYKSVYHFERIPIIKKEWKF